MTSKRVDIGELYEYSRKCVVATNLHCNALENGIPLNSFDVTNCQTNLQKDTLTSVERCEEILLMTSCSHEEVDKKNGNEKEEEEEDDEGQGRIHEAVTLQWLQPVVDVFDRPRHHDNRRHHRQQRPLMALHLLL